MKIKKKKNFTKNGQDEQTKNLTLHKNVTPAKTAAKKIVEKQKQTSQWQYLLKNGQV